MNYTSIFINFRTRGLYHEIPTRMKVWNKVYFCLICQLKLLWITPNRFFKEYIIQCLNFNRVLFLFYSWNSSCSNRMSIRLPSLRLKRVKRRFWARITNYYIVRSKKLFHTSELVEAGQYRLGIGEHAHFVVDGFTATPLQTASGHTAVRTTGPVIRPIWNTKLYYCTF